MWQKLTYSGKECNNYLYFAFDAETINTSEVTKTLGIEPTSLMIKKELITKSSSWKYRIDARNDIDLETHLEELIKLFEPKINEITSLKKKYNLETRIQFVIDIDINPDASMPFFGLNKRTIKFLGLTETEVDFDIYKADTIGLLDKLNEK